MFIFLVITFISICQLDFNKAILKLTLILGFPGGTVVKNPPANAGDTGSSPGPGRSHLLRSN